MEGLKLSTGKYGKGIKFHDRNQLWEARILINGSRVTLGYFQTMEEAEKAYQTAKKAKKNSSLNFLRSQDDGS